MNPALLIVPVVAAFIGWMCNKIALQFFIKRFSSKSNVNSLAANIPVDEIFSFDEISEKITDPANLQKIMPVIDEHIDHFLKVKLKQSMPVVGMFIGEKTIAQLKQVFLDELQSLFPQIMQNYAKELQNDFDLKKILAYKLQSVPEEKIQNTIRQAFSKQFFTIEMTGAIMGFVIGSISVFITYFIVK
ncbi:DUF445 domain-containing protein [Pinibacter soli]|uniref:DUF445 domain-containing protein n=1 Tax=Pinibacter soli TaxID=3044211 RepID=A0ABT6REB9_9BACT|nr:hypothetical protein [Pinibacter soli]MDI3320745.1 hypothetical protein [Pinibacter soli]